MKRTRGNKRPALLSALDQGLSSLTNLGAVVIAARLLGVDEFGKFAIVYGTVVLLVGLAQAFVSQPLVLTKQPECSRTAPVANAVALAVRCGFLAAVACCLGAIVAPSMRTEFLVAAACVPVLVAFDVIRFASAVLGVLHVAAIADACWLAAVLVGGLGIGLQRAQPEAWSLVLLWGLSGVLAGLVASGLLPRGVWTVRRDVKGLRGPGYLGYRFLVEFVVVRGANQMMVIGLGWFVSVRDAGVLRGVTTLYGPLNVLVQTVALFGAPVLLGLAPRQRARAIVWMGTGLCFVGAAMTVILLLVPQSVGRAFLGATWSGSGPLILPLGVQAIAVGIVAATFVGIRTVSPRLTLPVQMASSAVFVFLYGLGVWRDGVAGAAWAFGVGTLVQGALGAVVYRREVKKEALRAGARFEATGLETVSKGHASWTTHE